MDNLQLDQEQQDQERRATKRLFADLYPPHKGTLFEGSRDLCASAQEYLTICHTLLQEGEEKAAAVLGNPQAPVKQRRQALKDLAEIELRLERAFWRIVRLAPKSCQRRGLTGQGHPCVLQVFDRYQARIETMQRSFAGSVLDLPEPEVKIEYVKMPVPALELFPGGADVIRSSSDDQVAASDLFRE